MTDTKQPNANQSKNSQSNQGNTEQVSFFGKMLTFSRMKLFTDDFDIITSQLETVSPTKDSLIPIVIDSEVEIDLKKLTDLLWDFGLQPIGVTKGKLDEQAKLLRLAIFPADGKRMQRVSTASTTTTRKVVPVAGSANDETKDNSAKQAEKTDNTSMETVTDKTVDSEQVNTEQTTDAKKKPVAFTTAPLVKLDKEQTVNIAKDEAKGKETAIAESIEKSLIEDQAEEQEQAKENEANVSKEIELLDADVPMQVIQVVEQVTSLVYDQMLRSGQSINHVGGDLILTNSVNDGAEAITDNSLHIYGRGMGRLVAGATGDQNAHIFCQKFNPSLVSVAGTYMLRDSIPPEAIDRPVQVSYKEGEGLVFRVMDDWLNQNSNQSVITTR